MKPYAEKFYKSKSWQKVRNAYMRSQRSLCEICLANGIIKPCEIVHHKIELTPENIDNPEITLNYNNLELLCRQCHAEAHDKRKKCRRFTIGPDGEIIIKTPAEEI